VAALVAYVLVGAFIGLATWKLTETAIDSAHAPVVVAASTEAEPVNAVLPPPVPSGPYLDASLLGLLERQAPANGTVGLYVRNLTTGSEASINAGRVFPAASLYKVPIMVETVRQIRLGHLAADQKMTVQRAHWVPGSGVLQGRVGEAIPIRELLRLLIAESDNIAAMMLLDATGLANVNQSMQSLGLIGTRLLDYRAQGAYNNGGPYFTSAADMGKLLGTIATGQLVDQEASDEALRLLGQKQASDLLGESLPWNVKVAHKWGEIPGARHDAGLVFSPKFQYVVVVMTQDVDPRGSPSYIRDLSKTIYDFFEQQSLTATMPARGPGVPAQGEAGEAAGRIQ